MKTMLGRNSKVIVLAVAVSLVAAAPSGAASAEDERFEAQSHLCGTGPDDAQTIAACTAVIASKRYSGDDLAYTYFNRGLHYAKTQKYKEAIADFDAAIKLKPNFANAYFVRGTVKQVMGDQAGGDADIARAKAIDPFIGS